MRLCRYLFVIFSLFVLAASRLPWCSPSQASSGKWINSSSLINSTTNLLNFEKYYVGTSCKRALEFSQAWIPASECSIHRFTKSSIHRALKGRLAESKPVGRKKMVQTTDGIRRITWLFIGDSALRGIFCGVIHILEGSEVDGPCINRVCGGIDSDKDRGPKPSKRKPGDPDNILGAVSYLVSNRVFEMAYFDTQLVLKFVYTKTLNIDPILRPFMLSLVKELKRGDTLIHNSGEYLLYLNY